MPVKYQCVKCSRRFADWGAEKMGFRCPKDEKCPPDALGADYELIRVGSVETEAPVPAPTLKRRPKKEVIGTSTFDDDAVVDVAVDDEPFDRDDSDEEEESEEEETLDDAEEATEGETDEVDDEEDSDDEEELDGELEFDGETPDFEEDV